jgi:radical SAM superfamily enzyme YgiQ (UPF0313 family)
MGPPFLAGWLAPDRWTVRLHDESTAGPLRSPDEVGSQDLVVLTGMTSGLDRMLHLAAFAKTANPACVTVAGGPAVRCAPLFASERFDYACQGDVEEVAEAVADAFGREAAAREWTPRFELAPWTRGVTYLESSRSCNFRCSFCVIAADRRPYQRYPKSDLFRQLDAQPSNRLLVLVDNNFFGPDHAEFDERIAFLAEQRKRGRFRGWGALVTADFFEDSERLRRAADAGCQALFCGVESFDPATLVSYRKKQNLKPSPIDVIGSSLEHGILPIYGLILDVVHRTAEDLTAEVAMAIEHGRGILPNFVSPTIPYPATPFFRDLAAAGRLLPNVRVRDLNGSTLCLRPRDGIDRIAALIRDLGALKGFRAKALSRTAGAWARRELSPVQLAVLTVRALAVMLRRAPGSGSSGRTFVGPSEQLDDLYRPDCFVAPAYRRYFEPTFLTDDAGEPAAPFVAPVPAPVSAPVTTEA